MTSKLSPPSRESGEPAERAAADWTARLIRGPLKPAEQKALDAWLARDASHGSALAHARGAYDAASCAASDPQVEAMRAAALKQARPSAPVRFWIAAAATASLALFAGVWIGRDRDAEEGRPETARSAPISRESGAADARYATRIGERLTAALPDGSTVTLNTNSEVRVLYSAQARRIELLRGQAMFSVARRPDWPFEVRAGARLVRALGTEFEVRLDGRRVQVVVLEGRLAVEDDNAASAASARPAMELEAGERLVALADGTMHVAAVDAEALTEWRRGRLSFSAAPLSQAIAEINRYRTAPLVIEDPRVAMLTISGTYKTADAARFGEALAATLPVAVEETPEGRALLVWRSERAAHNP